jgi:predicted tellurium resistance membrane protein TerC
VSWRDLILIAGGLFLLAKAVLEIHKEVEGGAHVDPARTKHANFAMTMVQVTLMDLVFSLDSVITAVGMARELWVMITAVVVAIAVMMAFAGSISRFIHEHPTLKVLALSFLLLIGLTLIIEGARFVDHVPKGYLYFAMGFSFFVEMLNLKVIRRLKGKGTKREAPAVQSGG